jgi:hypothetical protein
VPLDIPQPERTLGIGIGIGIKRKAYANPARRKFANHVTGELLELKKMIARPSSTI